MARITIETLKNHPFVYGISILAFAIPTVWLITYSYTKDISSEQISMLELKIDDLNNKLAEKSSELKELEASLPNMSNDLESLKDKNIRLSEDNDRLARLASEYESKVKQLDSGSRTVTTSLKGEISNLKTALSSCRDQNQSLQSKIDNSVLIDPSWVSNNSAAQSSNGIVVVKVAGNCNTLGHCNREASFDISTPQSEYLSLVLKPGERYQFEIDGKSYILNYLEMREDDNGTINFADDKRQYRFSVVKIENHSSRSAIFP
ncbi:MAG: hypothetical protein KQI78_12165 [Deltaproteobacteria bacterium]|nr:hypothetical protein [Deltaproteobacteria bacterium]